MPRISKHINQSSRRPSLSKSTTKVEDDADAFLERTSSKSSLIGDYGDPRQRGYVHRANEGWRAPSASRSHQFQVEEQDTTGGRSDEEQEEEFTDEMAIVSSRQVIHLI
jgi:hypothetical protein